MEQVQVCTLVQTMVKFESLLIGFSTSCPQATDQKFLRGLFSINTRWRHLDLVLRRINDNVKQLGKARQGVVDPREIGMLLAAPSLDIETFYVVLRSLLEDVAALTPCFYPKAKMRPKRISFNEQVKWYRSHSEFDPPMTQYLESNLGWFDELKEVRDNLLHRQCDILVINSGKESMQGDIPIQFGILSESGFTIGQPEMETQARSILRSLIEFLSFYSSHFKNRLPNDWPAYKDLGGHSPKGGVQGLEFLKRWSE
jgi:hypothetical protein